MQASLPRVAGSTSQQPSFSSRQEAALHSQRPGLFAAPDEPILNPPAIAASPSGSVDPLQAPTSHAAVPASFSSPLQSPSPLAAPQSSSIIPPYASTQWASPAVSTPGAPSSEAPQQGAQMLQANASSPRTMRPRPARSPGDLIRELSQYGPSAGAPAGLEEPSPAAVMPTSMDPPPPGSATSSKWVSRLATDRVGTPPFAAASLGPAGSGYPLGDPVAASPTAGARLGHRPTNASPLSALGAGSSVHASQSQLGRISRQGSEALLPPSVGAAASQVGSPAAAIAAGGSKIPNLGQPNPGTRVFPQAGSKWGSRLASRSVSRLGTSPLSAASIMHLDDRAGSVSLGRSFKTSPATQPSAVPGSNPTGRVASSESAAGPAEAHLGSSARDASRRTSRPEQPAASRLPSRGTALSSSSSAAQALVSELSNSLARVGAREAALVPASEQATHPDPTSLVPRHSEGGGSSRLRETPSQAAFERVPDGGLGRDGAPSRITGCNDAASQHSLQGAMQHGSVTSRRPSRAEPGQAWPQASSCSIGLADTQPIDHAGGDLQTSNDLAQLLSQFKPDGSVLPLPPASAFEGPAEEEAVSSGRHSEPGTWTHQESNAGALGSESVGKPPIRSPTSAGMPSSGLGTRSGGPTSGAASRRGSLASAGVAPHATSSPGAAAQGLRSSEMPGLSQESQRGGAWGQSGSLLARRAAWEKIEGSAAKGGAEAPFVGRRVSWAGTLPAAPSSLPEGMTGLDSRRPSMQQPEPLEAIDSRSQVRSHQPIIICTPPPPPPHL